MWFQSEKSIVAWIQPMSNEIIQAPVNPTILTLHHPTTLEALNHTTNFFYKTNCTQLDFLPLELLYNIYMCHACLLQHNQQKPVSVNSTTHFFVCPRPMTSNTSPLTNTLITVTSNMCEQTDKNDLTTMSKNGERKTLSNMSLSNFTWQFKTSHPIQRLTCILNKFHYKIYIIIHKNIC